MNDPRYPTEVAQELLGGRTADVLRGDLDESLLWCLPEWVPERHVTVLAGAGGSFKSMLALQLLLCLGAGAPFLGVPTRAPEDLAESGLEGLGLFSEDSSKVTGIRTSRMLEGLEIPRDHVRNTLLVSSSFPIWDFENHRFTKDGKRLEQAIHDLYPALVVLDCAATFFQGGNDIGRGDVRAFMDGLVALETTVLLITHLSAEGRVAGSTDWVNAARSVIKVTRHGERVELHRIKSNWSAPGAKLHAMFSDGYFVLTQAPTNVSPIKPQKVSSHDALAFLKGQHEPD